MKEKSRSSCWSTGLEEDQSAKWLLVIWLACVFVEISLGFHFHWAGITEKKRIASRGLAQEEQWDLDVSQMEHGHPVAGMGMRNLCERKNKSLTVGKQ